jgi:hypothetical protein
MSIDTDEHRSLEKRFWSKVDIKGKDECWLWKSVTIKGGYGRFKINGKYLLAHRVAYMLLHGDIPEGIDILHTCDKPPCCNPYHVKEGTHSDNMQDMIHKGRINERLGIKNGNHKLTVQDVICIRIMSQCGYSDLSLSALYGVHDRTINKIRLRQTWKHI